MAEITCSVVTPEATVVEATTSFVVMPLYDGEVGVAVGHAPLIARLGQGELRFESEGTTHRYYVDGGFVQIADNMVSVLTDRAMPVSEIDKRAAQGQLESAITQRANTPEKMEARDKAINQARAQLRVSSRP